MTNSKAVVILLSVLAVLAFGVICRELAFVLPHLAMAFFLANIFKPMVNWLHKHKVPVAVSILFSLIIVALSLLVLGYGLYLSLDAFIAAAPRYQERLSGMVQSMSHMVDQSSRQFYGKAQPMDWKKMIDLSTVAGFAYASLGSFFSFLGEVALILLFMAFILAETRQFEIKIRKGFSQHSEKVAGIVENVDDQVRRYMIAKIIIGLIKAAGNALIAWIFGVDFILMMMIISFITNLIPNVGSIISTGFPVLIVLLQFDSAGTIIPAALLFIAFEIVIGNIIDPKIMSRTLNLSPLLVLLSLIVWGWLWGAWGMLLAVPITSVIKILFENIEPLKPIALLMSETPRTKFGNIFKKKV